MIEKQFEDLPQEFKKLNLSRPLYEPVPTSECSSGTHGRIAVLEVFEVDKGIERIILADPTEISLWDATQKGMISMKRRRNFESRTKSCHSGDKYIIGSCEHEILFTVTFGIWYH